MDERYIAGAKNGDWAERKRIWRHPLAGERLFHIYRGYITIRKVWNQRVHYEHVEPHDHAYLVYEYVTDTGMRYIEDGYRLMDKCSMADGSNINEYISRKRAKAWKNRARQLKDDNLMLHDKVDMLQRRLARYRAKVGGLKAENERLRDKLARYRELEPVQNGGK